MSRSYSHKKRQLLSSLSKFVNIQTVNACNCYCFSVFKSKLREGSYAFFCVHFLQETSKKNKKHWLKKGTFIVFVYHLLIYAQIKGSNTHPHPPNPKNGNMCWVYSCKNPLSKVFVNNNIDSALLPLKAILQAIPNVSDSFQYILHRCGILTHTNMQCSQLTTVQ